MTVRTIYHPDQHSPLGFHVERWQDCEAIVDNNKRLQGEAQHSDFMRHIASVPCIIIEKWLNEERARGNLHLRLFSPEFNEMVARKLRDPDWKWLRTDAKNPSHVGYGS